MLIQPRSSPFDAAWDAILENLYGEAGSETLRSLFPDNGRLEDRRYTKLHKIVLHLFDGNLEEEIHANPADVNMQDLVGRTALSWATGRRDAAAVNLLLNSGADPNVQDSSGNPPLSCTTNLQDFPCFELLLQAGANIAYKNSEGYNALHTTVSYGDDPEFITAVIRAGAELNGQNMYGHTPLACAVLCSHATAAETLLEFGAQINDCDYEGDTALMQSTYCNTNKITESLLRRGASHTLTNKNNNTILHHAARSGGLETLYILKAAGLQGLDTEAVNKQQKTALELAEEREDVPHEFVATFQELLATIRELDHTDNGGHINDEGGQEISDNLDTLEPSEHFEDAVEVQPE